jgi:hypothetical protein
LAKEILVANLRDSPGRLTTGHTPHAGLNYRSVIVATQREISLNPQVKTVSMQVRTRSFLPSYRVSLTQIAREVT